jgi:hypothetical protein
MSAFPDEIYTTCEVFDRSVDGFFLIHYNLLAKLEDTTRLFARRGCGKADELTGDCLDDHRFRHAYVNHPRYLE